MNISTEVFDKSETVKNFCKHFWMFRMHSKYQRLSLLSFHILDDYNCFALTFALCLPRDLIIFMFFLGLSNEKKAVHNYKKRFLCFFRSLAAAITRSVVRETVKRKTQNGSQTDLSFWVSPQPPLLRPRFTMSLTFRYCNWASSANTYVYKYFSDLSDLSILVLFNPYCYLTRFF